MPLVMSFCCNIPEGEDTSAVEHGVAERRPCTRCMVTVEDCVNARLVVDGMMEDTKMVIYRVLDTALSKMGSDRR